MEEAYRRLCEAQESPETWNDAGKLKALVSGFQEFIPCEDCQSRIHECQWRIYVLEDEKKKRKARKRKKNTIISDALLAAALVIALIVKLMITSLVVLPDQYRQAEALLEAGDKVNAAISFGKCGDYRDARERSFALWDEIAVRKTLCAGYSYTIAVRNDGTVAYAGEEGKLRTTIEKWTDIVAIDKGWDCIVGLKKDGTVTVFRGSYRASCTDNYGGWTDIVAVYAPDSYWDEILAVKADGTVLSDRVADRDRTWEDVEPYLEGGSRAVPDTNGQESGGNPEVPYIVAEEGPHHTVYLKSDGTVYAELSHFAEADEDDFGQCNVSDWTDIVAISAGTRHTVGLKSDGTMVATELTRKEEVLEYNGWSWTITYDYGQSDVSGWTDIKLPTGPLVVQ